MRTLSHAEARQAYNRIGAYQDTQAFYEDCTTGELVEHGSFGTATRVFEFGCGTGRFAETLLAKHLPAGATYKGIDLSPRMVRLALDRLVPYLSRAEISLSEGGPPVSEPAQSCDRWVSNFVLDLLAEEEIEAVLAEAHRMLRPGGLLCLASLSTGRSRAARTIVTLWSALHRLSPGLVGGCRPLELRRFLAPQRWRIVHHAVLEPYFIPSEAVVAARL